MDNKASPVEERALTNAIERAATVASINDSLDRNQLLAEQLKKASVDKRFAKTASAAFNKRLTVLIFKKTADEHKTDPFQLTDADTVYRLVAGEEPETKTAAAAGFVMGMESNTDTQMDKAASAKADPLPNLWEHRVSHEVVEKHIASLLDKHAHILFHKMKDLEKDEEAFDKKAAAVASYFKDTEYDYDFSTAVNLHGDALKDALKGHVPDYIQFEKTANFAIKPAKAIFDKVASLLADKEKLEAEKKEFQEYATSLVEFGATATRFGNALQMAKTAAPQPQQPVPQPPAQIANPNVPAVVNNQILPAHVQMPTNQLGLNPYNYAQAQAQLAQALAAQRSAQRNYDQMRESPGQQQFEATMGFMGSAAPDIVLGAPATLLAAATNLNKTVYDAGFSTLTNAYNMYSTGLSSVHPGDVLDADFLVRDRYHDRMMAWSDMTADPQFSMYPAEQVWNAVNKAMNMDLSLERPDRREVLRAYVGQLLAQNNRMSTADIAALAQTIRGMESSQGNAAAQAAARGEALADKEHKDLPSLLDPMAGIRTDKIEDFVSKSLDDLRSAEKDYANTMHEINRAQVDEAKTDLDKAKEKSKTKEREGETAAKDLLRSIVGEQERVDRENQRLTNEYQKQLAQTNMANARIQAANDTKEQQWDAKVRQAIINKVLSGAGKGSPKAQITIDQQGRQVVRVPRGYWYRGRLLYDIRPRTFERLVNDIKNDPARLAQLGVPSQP